MLLRSLWSIDHDLIFHALPSSFSHISVNSLILMPTAAFMSEAPYTHWHPTLGLQPPPPGGLSPTLGHWHSPTPGHRHLPLSCFDQWPSHKNCTHFPLSIPCVYLKCYCKFRNLPLLYHWYCPNMSSPSPHLHLLCHNKRHNVHNLPHSHLNRSIFVNPDLVKHIDLSHSWTLHCFSNSQALQQLLQ